MATPRHSKQVEVAGNGDLARTAQEQAERLWAVQGRLLNIYSGFMNHWLERRQQAAKSAVESAQKAFTSNGQPVNIPAIYGEWMKGSMQRVAADLQECQECGSEIATILEESMPHWSAGEGGAKHAGPPAKA